MVRYLLAGLILFSFLLSCVPAYADTSFNDLLSELEQQYQLPAGILGKVANVESGGKSGACGNSQAACGMFQWTGSSWYSITKVAYGTSLDLAQRGDAVTEAKMTALSLKQAENQNTSLIQQASLDLTLGLYMCHFLGSSGCSHFFQAYIQNPQQSAAAIFPKEAAANASIFNGRTLAGVLNLMAGRLQVSSGVSLAGNFTDANRVSLAYSDADVSPSSFMPANFVPPTQDPSRTYQTSYSNLSQNQSLTPLTQLTQPQLTSQLPVGTPQTSAATQSSAIIIAQPASVPRGHNLVVSWATAGMTSCQVSEQGTQISSATTSSQSVHTSSLQSGTVTFTLSCTDQFGQPTQESAFANVQ